MHYAEALRYLYGLQARGIRLELDRMVTALALRGNPHHGQRFVHVAGTNGKGSTCAMLASILRTAGYKTGLYTSPHLHRFVERIQVNGEPVTETEIAERVSSICATLEQPGAPHLTFFETTTLLALEIFQKSCDVVVLETGLGGRLDATNVVDPVLTIITEVGMDHCDRLGNTLQEIAYEKSGIIKPGVPVVVGAHNAEVKKVITETAAHKNSPLFLANKYEQFHKFIDQNKNVSIIESTLFGEHQKENAACVRSACQLLQERGFSALTDTAIEKGLQNVQWPGRFEQIREQPRVVLDVAHNPDGCVALVKTLKEQGMLNPAVLIFSAMRDKSLLEMADILSPHFDACIYALLDLPRASLGQELSSKPKWRMADSAQHALHMAQTRCGTEGQIVITGSHFLVGELRAHLLGLASDPPIPM